MTKVSENGNFLHAITPAGQIILPWACWERANEKRLIFDTIFCCDVRKGHHSKSRRVESIVSVPRSFVKAYEKPAWYENMPSSEEFSDSSTEGYLSDDSECLDFQEIETEERANQELPSESSTSDQETDSELQAYTDEPLADEE